MMDVDRFLFSKIILGDPELQMHYHIRKPSPKFHHIINSDLTLLKPGDLYAATAPRSLAKFLALDELVLTDIGWCPVKNINTGDKIFGSDGKTKSVIGLSDIVKKPLYRVTTRDGRSLVVSDDHLWTVRWLEGFHWNDNKIFTYTTAELIEKYHRKRFNKRYKKIVDCYRLAIECPKSIDLSEKKYPIDPYTLGVLIGDGNMTNTTPRIFSSKEDVEEMRSYINGDVSDIKYPKERCPYFFIRKMIQRIKDLKLNVTSHYKFIPEIYLDGSIEQRIELLRGIMDTDGTICLGKSSTKNYRSVAFATVSKKLADDVVYLVRSLGGRTVKTFHKNDYSGYYYVGVHMEINPFKLKRKADNFIPSKRLFNAITNIEYVGEGEARCLKVDSDDELFVANDFLLTHNTTLINLVYPLHELTYNRCRFLLMISESETQSKFNLDTLGTEIEENPKYKFFYGDRKGDKWGQETKEIITGMSPDGKKIVAKILVRGVDQKVRGLKFGPYRPSHTIMDDAEGEAHALTMGQRAKLGRWVDAQVIPGSESGILIFIGTIIDDLSYLNKVAGTQSLDKKGKQKIKGWKTRFFQAITQKTKPGEFVGEGNEIIGKDGIPEVLWKEKLSYQKLMEIKERLASGGNPQVFFQEYQNIPTDDSFRIFKRKDIQYHEAEYRYDSNLKMSFLQLKDEDGEWKEIPVNIGMGVDPASSEKTTADFTVVLVIAVDKDYNIYVLEYFRGQVSPMDGAEQMWRMMEEYHPRWVNIEDTGHKMLSNYLMKLSKNTGKFFPINPKDAIKSKFHRIMSMQPKFGQKAVWIRETHNELESELLRFTKEMKHLKDTLDALEWAMEDMFAPAYRVTKEGKIENYPIDYIYDWETGQLIPKA